MNVLSCSINTLIKEGFMRDIWCRSRPTFLLANRGFQVHAQVLITSWVVIAILGFRSSSGSQSTNHSNWRPKLL
uniref:Uncharacterized protein n=1 Tax=Brassica campestris TaxID=3711 RepID=A0A3P6D526_BRACM|nr:unnamed protein product [Brassica rapa]